MTVQTISSVVCPCTGGPSDQSPGLARKLMHRVDQDRRDDREDDQRDDGREPVDEVDPVGLLGSPGSAATAPGSRRVRDHPRHDTDHDQLN